MKMFTLKKVALAVAFALPIATSGSVFAQGNSNAGGPPEKPGKPAAAADKGKKEALLNRLFGKPGSRKGLVKTNKQVFYAGDTMKIDLVLPRSIKPLFNGEAEAQLVMYVPDGDAVSFPVDALGGEGTLVEAVIDTSAIPAGVYELAVVLVEPGGDAVNVSDWYKGFGALVSVSRVKISDDPSADEEDADGDGMIDGDTSGDGYVDDVIGDDDFTDGTDDSEESDFDEIESEFGDEEEEEEGEEGDMPPPPEGEEGDIPPPPEGEEGDMPPPPEGEEGDMPPPPEGEEGDMPPPPPEGGEGDMPPPPPEGEEGDMPPPPEGGEGDMPPPPPEGEEGDMPPPPPEGEEEDEEEEPAV